jgi:hypothetical protein
MKRVVIESPFAGDVDKNKQYGRLCMLDCLRRGEAPFASHLLYTQCLDDNIEIERTLGMNAGFVWGEVADLHAFYVDLGMSPGMEVSLRRIMKIGSKWEERSLPNALLDAL